MYVIKAVTYKGPYESNEDAVCFNNNGNIKYASTYSCINCKLYKYANK